VLNQLVNSDSLFRFGYLSEINKHYGEFLSPTATINKQFQTPLESVLSAFTEIDDKKAYDRKNRVTFDSSKLKFALSDAIREMDANYFRVV
jgi:hypothetical protein